MAANTSMEASAARAVARASAEMAAARRIEVVRSILLTRQAAMTVVAIILFFVFSASHDAFMTIGNILDIVRSWAFVGIVAVTWTYLLISGELDLSVGSAYGFGTIFMGWLIVSGGLDPWYAAGLTLLYGAIVGLINGVITVYVGVRAFVVTLGMLSLLRGVAHYVSGSFPISFARGYESSLFPLGGGTLIGIPVQAVWFVAVLAIGFVVLRYTKFGYWLFATGGSELAAQESGIPTRRIKLAAFVLVGFSCGLIAVLQGAWLNTVTPTTGLAFELQVIGAVLIGGTALTGGEGSIYGTLVGTVILAMVTNGLVLIGLPPAAGLLATGGIVIGAGTLDAVMRRTGERAAQAAFAAAAAEAETAAEVQTS